MKIQVPVGVCLHSGREGRRGVERSEKLKKSGKEDKEERGQDKMRDVALNDSSPPASWHAEVVHVSVRKRVGICE